MRVVYSRAPSRVDFGGGTLDLPFFVERERGATLNCAVSKYGYSSLGINNRQLEINSINYKKRIKVDFPIKYNGNLDLLKAAFRVTGFDEKATLNCYHEMRPHSRLGTSSSVSVSVLGAINKFKKKKIDKVRIADVATYIEREELNLMNGFQDQYAASFGGILMLRFNGKKICVEKVRVKDEVVFEMEKNFLLCYLNSNRVAGNVNSETLEGYEKGDKRVVGAIKNIKSITFDMYKCLKRADMDGFYDLLNEENKNREVLSKSIVTPDCKRFINIGLKNGAVAAKILGSGAGGTLLFCARDNQKKRLVDALTRNGGVVFDFRMDFKGLEVWERGLE